MKKEIQKLNSSKSILDDFFMIDAELLPLVNKANKGDIDSIIEIGCAFMDGKNAKKDDDLAIKYFELLFDTLPKDQYLAKYYTLYNIATIISKTGDYDSLMNVFHNIVLYMLEEIPKAEWHFDLFEWISECVEWKKNQD